MIRRILAGLSVALLAGLCLTIVVACGGGVGSGGTGAPASATRGTVNGFGSVIVDGVRFDDSQVPTLREDAPGIQTQTAAVLGDSVEIASTSAGVVSSVVVDATLVGSVTSLGTAGSFVVMGQTVTVNDTALLGPITQYSGGYVGNASVAIGDAVEVHGLIVRQASGFTVQATRVGRLNAMPDYLKVTGIVSALGNNAFNLGALQVHTATASLLPQGGMLVNGAVVSVLGARGALATGAAGAPQLVAAQVRIKKIGSEGDEVAIGGVAVNLDVATGHFDLGGVSVFYSAASVLPGSATLANGRYVRVRGVVAADGSVRASTATILDGVSEPEAELNGNISVYVASTKTFVVRGVTVDASQAIIQGCPASGLADGQYVEVEGGLSATGVVATQVHCEGESAGSTVERTGVASAVDAVAATFVLTPSSGVPINAQWTASTYFNEVTPATLSGKRVEVQGVVVNGVLMVQRVEPD